MAKLSTISLPCSPLQFDDLARRISRDMDADMLLSAPGFPSETSSVIGVRPRDELVFSPDTTPEEIKRFCFDTPGPALGFVSYDYGMGLRGVPSDKSRDFPLGHLKKYGGWIEFDRKTEELHISATNQSLHTRLLALPLPEDMADPAPVMPELPATQPTQSLEREPYEAGVRETLERILSGYTYQLNLSTKLSWDCPDLDPLSLFHGLRARHPAPFYAWIRSGTHRVISTSPERFLRVADGHVLSQPIKGTLKFDAYSDELVRRLTSSPKEDAELSMIVDLIRNDISANCEYGSVRVDNHKSVFAVDDLLQMYSDVTGTLRRDRDCLDLFLDAFPGGSVTGCPKHSSMTIIEELEPHTRGVYCGSVVLIRDARNMDSSIAIRTAAYDTEAGRLDSYAGSGIVVDSHPASEYQETMAKIAKFLKPEAL